MTRRKLTIFAALITLTGGISLRTQIASAQVAPDREDGVTYCCQVEGGPKCCGTDWCYATTRECSAR